MTRAVAVVDGEHYAPVVRDALERVPHRVVAAYLAGGTEKLRPGDDYGVPLVADLDEALAELEPDVVVDLSDEPVLGPAARFRLASRVLAHGIRYEGPDFRFDPPSLAQFAPPSLGVVGTGKRVGKTAVTGYAARLLSRSRSVVVVAMGRGGPPEPEVVELRPTVEDLLELSRAGRHAASDYLETAALAGVVTVGCRRCGGGLAGAVGVSNVLDGAALAAARRPDLVLFDGSGAALPPVRTGARVLVAGAHQGAALVTGYLNAYRVLTSDLVLLTMAEDGSGHETVAAAVADLAPGIPVIACVLRPRPLGSVAGRRVALFTTAPPPARELLGRHLRDEHGAADVRVSGNLASRDELRRDLEGLDAEVYVVEIKAAAIDVVAEAAAARGLPLVFADNDVRPLPGEPDLDEALESLGGAAAEARPLPSRGVGVAPRPVRPSQARIGRGIVTERRRGGALLGGEEGLPYSKGLMARALIAAGVSAERAYVLARRIESDLRAGGHESIAFDRLEELADEVLGDEEGRRASRRLRRYADLWQLDAPLIVLVGGATGTGKSTVATEAAWRLGITRVTSTDFVRQTMRAFFSQEFMPSIHYSSFEAAAALRAPEEADDPAIAGFLEQTRNVLVGVRAALERALEERWSMVLEGVHIVPGLLPARIDGAVVVQCVLAIEDEEEHRAHFEFRDVASRGVRPLDKYIRGFPEIRRIQDEIVARAKRTGVPVVENGNVEQAIGGVMELVLESAELSTR